MTLSYDPDPPAMGSTIHVQGEDMIRERVRRGIAMLDNKGPRDWRYKIDLGTLDMISSKRCVLGQVYGFLGYGLNELGMKTLHAWMDDPKWREVCDHGFALLSGDPVDFGRLTEIWREELERRPDGSVQDAHA